MTTIHLVDNSIVRGVANSEGLVLRTSLVGTDNLVQRGSTVNHRETNRTRSRILTSSRDRVGGLRRSHSRGTCDGASRSIQIHTRRKRRIGSARSESICSGSNTHALETTIERERSLGIAEGGRHRTIAHQELNLIQVNGSVLSSTKRHSVHRETVGGNSTIELRPRASRMASSRSRVKLQEGSSSRVRSLNRKGSRMTAGITVRPNADRRDSGNEGTHARVGERSGNGGRGRIRVTSPRDRIAVVVDASARHSEIHRSNVAVVLVGDTSAKSEVSVELDSRRDARLREMELHSEHTRRVGSSISRTVDSAVVIDTIASSSHRSSGHITFRHVVTIYLHTVDVGDDTVLIEESQLNRSHVRQTGEGLAEVLGSSGLLRSDSENNRSPRSIRIVHILPVAISIRVVLPFLILVDGGVQREIHRLLSASRHHHLERKVSVHTVDFKPSTIRPRITRSILHLQGVLAVRRSSKTGFNRSHSIA